MAAALSRIFPQTVCKLVSEILLATVFVLAYFVWNLFSIFSFQDMGVRSGTARSGKVFGILKIYENFSNIH